MDDLEKWLYSLAPLSENLDDLNAEQLQSIMKVYHVSPEERKNALTGRMIYGFIKSGYTTAGKDEYKPWVDLEANLSKSFSENN